VATLDTVSAYVAAIALITEQTKKGTTTTKNLNDLVEQAHLALLADDKYAAFLSAVENKDAIEGSLEADDYVAAKMIREWAMLHGILELGREQLASILKALKVVLRRYGLSRKQRRERRQAN
jgi:hypothetical protein